MKGEHNILNIFRTKKYIKEKKNQQYYPYFRTRNIRWGYAENGKTISATKRILDLLKEYPELTFITNVKIKGIENAIYFTNSEELVEELKKIDIEANKKGYLIFIDEIHVVLAELFGKSDPIFLQFLSQQRKLSIHIIGTSQMFNKLPKFIRDYLIQSGQIIVCNNFFKVIQWNKWVEMETVKEDSKGAMIYEKARIQWFIHNKELYESYDTFAVISQIKGLMKGSLTYGARLSSNNGPTTEKLSE